MLLLEAICHAFGLAQGQHAQQVSERVWRVPHNDGDVAVKIYAAEQGERARKEAAVLAHLQPTNHTAYRVQTLLCTMDGATTWSGLGSHALATKWVQGSSKTYDTFTPQAWSALGASLAALHERLLSLQLPGNDTLKDRLQAVNPQQIRHSLLTLAHHASQDNAPPGLQDYTHACQELFDTHYARCLDNFPQDDPQHPIHNDYNQFNYLFDEQALPLILDWEASIGAPREYELVRCLNHLPLEAPELARRFIQAYAQAYPISPDRIAWAVDAACLQHGLKRWVWDGWLRDPESFDLLLNGSMRLAFAMHGARRRLIDFFTECL